MTASSKARTLRLLKLLLLVVAVTEVGLHLVKHKTYFAYQGVPGLSAALVVGGTVVVLLVAGLLARLPGLREEAPDA